ncbi:ABC transporter permease [Nocardiopsis potens]|uniref:ABC transporter permease n=1 Tax=Nocardiopsis potens TaxID=1246458 RepID=UPI001F4C7628|nr:ABC transporter permease [Nocardiopsis potens]
MANEFAKMRGLRVAAVAGTLIACTAGLSLLTAVTAPAFADPAGERSWEPLLASMALAVPLASPVLLAVLASRQVDIEHRGGGWLLSQTSGITPGRLCRIKFAALGCVVSAATALQSLLLIGAGVLLGVAAPVPVGAWAGYTASVAVVNLVLLALHVLVSARVDNQLVGLGLGVLGSVLAATATGLPPWLAHTFPWGYYALATAADYRDGALVMLAPDHSAVAALGAAGAALFLLATALFDRRED